MIVFNYTLGINKNSGNFKWSVCLNNVISVRANPASLKFPLIMASFYTSGCLFYFFFHTSQVLWILYLFSQISPMIKLKHSTGITPHAFVCPPSLSVWLRSAVCFCLIRNQQNLEIGHSVYCTTQADIIMTEESTAVIQRKYTPFAQFISWLCEQMENLSSPLIAFVERTAY